MWVQYEYIYILVYDGPLIYFKHFCDAFLKNSQFDTIQTKSDANI